MIIAAAQIKVINDQERNLGEILKSIEEASKNNAEFICFPEACLNSDQKIIKDITEESKKIQAAAKHFKINVIFGTYVKDKGRIHNEIWVISKDGEIVYKYSKRHPYVEEIDDIVAGAENKVLKIGSVDFAVINCWDYAYPEDIRQLARQGAKIIFCPSYLLSHPRTKDVLDKMPQVRAFDSMAYFVMVDAVAIRTFKHSKICHPLRELAKIANCAGIIYADINLEEIDGLRKSLPNF